MNYLDLFSGIGGFHKGLLQAGFHFNWCGYSEIDKYAKQIYQKHFPESEGLGDVRTIKVDRLPKINLITFGFPCQDLSIAGKRGGITASRSGLFFEAMRIIRITRPKYFIFENVKGLFSSNEGRDWFTILREIADSGYDGQWQLLNTRWFLPQNRERIFFVGHIRGECRPEIFPIGESNTISLQPNVIKTISENGEGIAYTLDTTYHNSVAHQPRTMIQINENINQGQRIYNPEGIACSIKSIGGGQGAKTGLYAMKWQRNEKGKLIRKMNQLNGIDYTPFNDGCRELVEKENNIVGNIMSVGINKDCLIKDNIKIRRLTPIECERLQGFPDNWTEGISDTQRYKCIGNAVSIPIVEEIGKRLLKYERN